MHIHSVECYIASSKNIVKVHVLVHKNLPDILSDKNKLENKITYDPIRRLVQLMYFWTEKFCKCILQNGNWLSLVGLWTVSLIISIY